MRASKNGHVGLRVWGGGLRVWGVGPRVRV